MEQWNEKKIGSYLNLVTTNLVFTRLCLLFSSAEFWLTADACMQKRQIIAQQFCERLLSQTSLWHFFDKSWKHSWACPSVLYGPWWITYYQWSNLLLCQREKFTFKSRKLLANHWRKSNKREASIPMSELSE